MARLSVFICLLLTVSACGGREAPRQQANVRPPALPVSGDAPQFAAGPISTACLAHQRPRATPARCSCIQAAANNTLSQSQQKRSTLFFSEPGRLQDVRQSDAPANERFWAAWKQFAETAEKLCGRV